MKRCHWLKPVTVCQVKFAKWTRDDRLRQPVFLEIREDKNANDASDWLNIKSRPQQEFVVGGFTEGKGSRKHLGALLLGAYQNGTLRYFIRGADSARKDTLVT
jgi:ATP-dependent DNA ligase